MGIQMTTTRIKGSHYLLIPKDLAELLEISDRSLLNLTIEDSEKGQRLIYSISENLSKTEGLDQALPHKRSAASTH